MELINITYKEGEPVVSARELHEWLKVSTAFRHWMPRMFEYGFTEGCDYTPVIFEHPQNNQQLRDFALTLDCAKEVSMIQRTDKGKEARMYFIEKEKELRAIQSGGSELTPAEFLLSVAKRMVEKEREDKIRDERIGKLEAKATTRPEWYSIAGYASLVGRPVKLKQASALGRKASALCKAKDIEPDYTHDPRFGKVKVYPVEVLEKIFVC